MNGERTVFTRLRLEVTNSAGHSLMNFSSPNYDDVMQLRDKMVARSSTDGLIVEIYEERFTERLLFSDVIAGKPVLVSEAEAEQFENIGL